MYQLHYLSITYLEPPSVSRIPGEFNTVDQAIYSAIEIEVADFNLGCTPEDNKITVEQIREEYYTIMGDENLDRIEYQDTVYLKQKGEDAPLFIITKVGR